MKEISNFFERIIQILEYYDIKSINSFATEHLKYDSSEKINRLKKDNTYPSFQILCDITNKFEYINAKWLLTGRGEMIIGEKITDIEVKPAEPAQIIDKVTFDLIMDRYEALAVENSTQKKQIKELEDRLLNSNIKRIYKLPGSDDPLHSVDDKSPE